MRLAQRGSADIVGASLRRVPGTIVASCRKPCQAPAPTECGDSAPPSRPSTLPAATASPRDAHKFPAVVAAAFRGGRVCSSPAVAVLALTLILLAAPPLRAEYLVLRSGQRLSVTGYQLQGDIYHLQLNGGTADLPASEVVAIEPEEIFTSTPAPAATAAKSQFHDLILTAAARYHVDPDLITSVIAAESNFDPKAISRRNARGLMQLLPQTATQLGVKNIFDPTENIDAGTHYLSTLLDRYHNNLALTLAAYNAGPQSVQRYGTIPPFRETRSYVAKVSRTYAQHKSPPQQNTKPTTPIAKSPVTTTLSAASTHSQR